MAKKGSGLEELIRSYFFRQGYFALRGVPYRFEGDEVTDIDVWLYGRQAASGRIRVVVDAKDKKTPKALERILWTKGLQATVGADRAVVVTTDGNPRIVKFARDNKISVITKSFLLRLKNSDLSNPERITFEEFCDHINQNQNQKQDGDWIRRIADSKAAVVSLPAFQAFNFCANNFRFFAERIETRPLYKDQALRCAYFTASLACISLDAALERIAFDDQTERARAIYEGVTFGDAGDSRTQKSIQNVLALIAESLENGKVVAVQAENRLRERFAALRGDVISEYFSKEANSHYLFPVARELETKSHQVLGGDLNNLSTDAKSTLGVFADFIQAKRSALFRSIEPSGAVPAAKAKPFAPKLL